MGMVSMKTGDRMNECCAIADNPYGYGLCIYLNEEQVEALGLGKNPPAAGSTVSLRAIAKVVQVTQEADPGEEVAEGESASDVDVELRFQITDLEVMPQGGTTNIAAAIYPTS